MYKEGTLFGELQRGWQRLWRLSWWWKAPIIGLLAIISLIVVTAVAGGGGDDDPGSVVQATATASPTGPTPTASPTSTATPLRSGTPTAAAPTATPIPTPEPTPEPTATPQPGFGDGGHIIGEDVQPGIYRSTGDSFCYWARLRGFSGELDDIIANGTNTPEIVAISSTDVGFEAQGCGQWLPLDLTAPSAPAITFGDGTYQVGVHIQPGRYVAAAGGDLCYWARFSDFSQELDGIIANGLNPSVVDIAPTDAGFSTFGCGTWVLLN